MIRLPPTNAVGPISSPNVIQPNREAHIGSVVRNNVASALTFVSGEGRILIVDDSGAETQSFAQALRASQLDVQVASATVLTDPSVAGSYDAIVLANIARWNLDQAADHALEVAVHDLGVGLLMIGGDHSFGAGGWTDSETAKALPVEMNPPQERQLPRGALALIIDCSGSMGSPVAGSNMDQQQCANEAAIAGIRTLSAGDQVTVIAFDDSSSVVVPLMNVENPDAIAKQIRRIGRCWCRTWPRFARARHSVSVKERRQRFLV